MNYKKYNDYELIYMVRENDDYSRDVLLKKYQPIIYSLASEYYSSFKSYGYDYDDFIQESSIAFLMAVLHYNEEKNNTFYTFAVLCIRRKLLSFCRKISNSSKNISVNNTIDIDEYVIPDEKSDLFSIMNGMELVDIFRQVILDLPIEISSIFELKINGFTYCEIGILLDIPSSTVEYKNRVAKNKLQNCLNNYYINQTI